MQYDNYYSDFRVRASRTPKPIFDFDKQRATVKVYDDDDTELEVVLPAHWEVCGTCEGRGSHVNPSIDCNGLSAEDFAEDPDFAEEYMSGRFDVTCYGCNGRTTELVIDRERCEFNEEDKKNLKLWDKFLDEWYENERMYEAERRFGC
jgi:hypothetical protein